MSLSPPPVQAVAAGPRLAIANSLGTAMILSVGAGYLDAFTFLGHGQSFASAITGNIVLFGLSLTRSWTETLAHLYPIVAFVAGAALATLLSRPGAQRHLPFSPHLATLLLEIAVLAAVAAVPTGRGDPWVAAAVTVTVAMQNTSFRKIGGRSYNSIIMTGNLQNFANALATGPWSGDGACWAQMRDLGGVIVSFIGGAALGAVATPRLGNPAAVPPAVLLALLALVLAPSPSEGRVSRAS